MRNAHIYATPAQESYIRHLQNQCFAKGIEGYYLSGKYNLLKSEASKIITLLKSRLEAAKK